MREAGRAMRTTPRKEMMPATCSLRVNGSFRRIEQAQQATIGARKPITVASDKGRYLRESSSCQELDLKPMWRYRAYSRGHILLLISNCQRVPPMLPGLTSEKSTKPTCDQESTDFPRAERCSIDFGPPLVDAAENESAGHASK